jgi:hypothetical protein
MAKDSLIRASAAEYLPLAIKGWAERIKANTI